MKISREVRVGLLAVVAVAMVLFGISYLRGSSVFNRSFVLYARYANVQGLATGDKVSINGMQVGTVKELALDPTGRSVLVRFQLETDVRIPNDSRATIRGSIISGSTVSLRLGKAARYVASGDTLAGELDPDVLASIQAELGPVATQIQAMTKEIGATVHTIRTALDSAQLRRIVGSVEQTAQHLDQGTRNLNRIMQNVEALSQTLARNQQNLDRLMANAATGSDTLRIAIGQLNRTLQTADSAATDIRAVIASLKAGNGTAGKLLYDEALYDNLNKSAANLDRLLVELREHPARFLSFSVFGQGDTE